MTQRDWWPSDCGSEWYANEEEADENVDKDAEPASTPGPSSEAAQMEQFLQDQWSWYQATMRKKKARAVTGLVARAKARRPVNVQNYLHVTLLWLGRGTSGARSLFHDFYQNGMVDYTCSVGPETIVQSLA